jgi:nitroreductase
MTTVAGGDEARQPDHPVERFILERWSPRAFDGSAIPERDLASIFEAARWAPSAFNAQPWRFIYSERGDSEWQRLLDLLIPFNVRWAQHAGVLIFICSDKLIEMKPGQMPEPSHTHSFDAGAAWAMLALQATALGYHAHGMSGVDFARAHRELAVPERFRVEAAVAIGKMGDKSLLPDSLRAREAPSKRKPLSQLVFRGRFPA